MARIVAVIASIGCAALLAACGDDSSRASERPSAEPEPAQPAAEQPHETLPAARRRGPLVKLRNSQLGPVLFDGRDRALYFFTRESRGRNRCRGECAEAWPPFFARARPRAARGVKRSLLGTIRRGTRRQVTYKGQRLYLYAHDPKGEVLCNDIVEFGGTWFALTAQGNAPS